MEILTELDGTVVAPSLHDGLLVSIEYQPNGVVFLRGQTVGGDAYCFLLSQVEAFRADGLLDKNIILDITIRKGPDVQREEIIEALKWQGYPLTNEFWSRLLGRITAGELVLFQLNPSYGASVGCICQGVGIA